MKNVSIKKKIGFICLINLIFYVVSLASSLFFEKHTSINVGILFLICALTAVVVVVGLGRVMLKSIMKPLDEVGAAVKLAAEGNLGATISFVSKDETGVLAENMRSLLKNMRMYISDISKVLGSMAAGDMTAAPALEYPHDFAPIKKSLEGITASVNHLLTQMQAASQQIASGADQISSGSQAMAQGAMEQAGAVEELASSMDGISNQIKQNADHTQNARTEMDRTTHEIKQGDEHMKKLVCAMDTIAQTSMQIQKIINVIDDIAFQTNILALNAAVEAARAGAAGKGFSIVADEVRNLASRSADAAKDTASLIQGTLSAIENGNGMMKDAGKALDQIANQAEQVDALIRNIAHTSEAQAGAVEQINLAVNQVSTVIQTNSATAEESAAASEELAAQSDTLRTLVSGFQLRGQA